MRFIVLLNLLTTTATASMASDFARKHPSSTANKDLVDDPKNGVGLRGWRGLARGGAKGSKPGKFEPPGRPGGNSELRKPGGRYEPIEEETYEEEEYQNNDSSPSSQFSHEKKKKHHVRKEHPNKSNKAANPPTEAESFAEKMNTRMKPIKTKPRKEKPDMRNFSPPSYSSEDEKEEEVMDSRMKPSRMKPPKEKVPKTKPEKAPKKKDNKRWASPKEAVSIREWPPTPSPTFGRPTLAPTEEPTTFAPTIDETYEPTPSPTFEPTSSMPTLSPTLYPTFTPTFNPVVDVEEESPAVLTPCPPHYDPSYTNYAAGDAIEMNSHVFVCNHPPYEEYCNIVKMDESWNATIQELFQDAWGHMGECDLVEKMPSEEVVMVGEATTMEAPIATTTTTIVHVRLRLYYGGFIHINTNEGSNHYHHFHYHVYYHYHHHHGRYSDFHSSNSHHAGS